MKIGLCCRPQFAETAKKAGFDYWEIGLNEVTVLGEDDFKKLTDYCKRIDFFPETSNRFFINEEHKLTGEDATSLDVLLDWTRKSLERAEALGVKVAVVGSGRARSVPEGYDPRRAREEFANLLYKMGDIAKPYGMALTLEPLRYEETNFINTVKEGIDLVKYVKHPNILGLADLYHMLKNEEGYEGVARSEGLLAHTHAAHPERRRIPATSDGFDYTPFKNALDACGYTDRISLEGGFDDDKLLEQGMDALEAFKMFR